MRRLAWAFLLLPMTALACDGRVHVVDASNSTVEFTVTQGDVPFSGTFSSFGGEFCSESDRLVSMQLWLAPDSVAAGLPEVNELLKGSAFFAVADHPRIDFRSTSVNRQGDRVTVTGELTIKGITRQQQVTFQWKTDGVDREAKGRFVLDRLVFDLGSGEWVNTDYLSADVDVTFDARLVPETS